MTFSEEISEYLDNIGYSDIKRKRKRDLRLRYQRRIRVKNGIDTIISYIVLLGSRVEGSDIVGSDRDFVEVESTSNFFEQACIHTRHDCDACCTIESDASLPGYVMIRTTAKYDTKYSYMYTTRSGKNYLSSKFYIQARLYDARKQRGSGFVQIANGPSLAIAHSRITFDHTHAYVYHCPNIITRWVAAKNGDWPPQDVTLKVASLPAFLVPIGQKGAPDEDLQWRICFNLGELVLVNSLNNTQFKVYLILKVWKKILLGTLCKSMTFQDIMEHETMKLFKCDECASLVVSGAES